MFRFHIALIISLIEEADTTLLNKMNHESNYNPEDNSIIAAHAKRTRVIVL